MSGPTGFIGKESFQDRITFDEILNYSVPPRVYESYRYHTIIHIHYFLNGLEVGYWSPITGLGFVFEKPRIWCDKLKSVLR